MSKENQPTPAESAAMHMFGILYAVLNSDKTPMHTRKAIIDTIGHVVNDPNGPFQTDDDINEMGAVFVNAINRLLPKIRGEQMLSDILSKPESMN